MPATKRSNRKEQILQALAQMLETSPGQRIT
ncbi:MAG: nucleoid occlusion factor SlmA, partial [Pseudomonadota bacterium]|nr:nucleoid occlusion factor SlmA [Pseudomonadota bacterium]